MPTVLITGANRGIGLGLVKAYLAMGWEVIATCRHPEKASQLKGLRGKLEIRTLDVSDHLAIDALAGKLKRRAIDVLINNAGVLGSPSFKKGGAGQTLGDMDYRGLRHTLEVNTISPLKMTEAFAEQVAASDQKKIITITSAMGSIGTMGGEFIAYRTSKAAVNAVMRNLSLGLKEKGIVIAVLHPGWVRTDMGSQEAPLSIEESVKGVVREIDRLTIADSGCFKTYQGETVPW